MEYREFINVYLNNLNYIIRTTHTHTSKPNALKYNFVHIKILG